MQFLLPFSSKLFTIVIIAALALTVPASAAIDHPVIQTFSGPSSLSDGYAPTGSAKYSAIVTGGSPPYTYTWMAPAGLKTLFEGTQYASVNIPANNLYSNGPGQYWVWLSVTDSAGKPAVWVKDDGLTSTEFAYGLVYNGKSWSVKQEPASYPYKMPAGTAQTTGIPVTTSNCIDSGTRFSSIQGEVKFLNACKGTDTWTVAKMDSVLYAGDHVKTGEDSTCVLGFSDMSTYMLKPESEIILSYPPGQESKLGIVAGNIWINVKKMVKDGSMEVDMTQAVAGIKGTTFVCEVTPARSTVKVIEGTVTVTSKKTGETKTVGTGQIIQATDVGMGVTDPFDANSEKADWEAVQAKAASGAPAPASGATKKSPVGLLPVFTAIGVAVALFALRRA